MREDFTEIIVCSKMKNFFIFLISLLLLPSTFGNLSKRSLFMKFYKQLKEQIEKSYEVDNFENLSAAKIFDWKKKVSPTATDSNFLAQNVDTKLDLDETNLFHVSTFSNTRVKRKANQPRKQTRKHKIQHRISRRKSKRKMRHKNRSHRRKSRRRYPILLRQYRHGRIVEITSTSGLGRSKQ